MMVNDTGLLLQINIQLLRNIKYL